MWRAALSSRSAAGRHLRRGAKGDHKMKREKREAAIILSDWHNKSQPEL
jgi:hypothetical protein